jgi:uncharacterized protein YndB with AHSA1/START domain
MNNNDQIIKVIDIKASVSRVWQALTDYQQFGEWFMVKLNEPFAPGSRSTGVTTYPGYEGHEWLATIELLEPETLFSYHWYHEAPNMDRPLAEQPTTRVEFRLEATASGTRLTITESGFSALPESMRANTIRSNTQGWDIQAQNIADYVAAHP